MSKQANKTLIGAFILGAVALTVVAILALGGGNLFGETRRYVMYFPGSVKGLGVGAPVQLKGVTVGTVKEIHLVYDRWENLFLTEVLLEVPEEGSVKIIKNRDEKESQKERFILKTTVETMIANGLRAKLQLQSFVTGQLLVALDFYPDAPVNLMGFDNDYEELPTLPSDMEALAKTFDAVDFQSIVDSAKNAINGIEDLATSPKLHEAMGTLNDTLSVYRQLATNLDRHVVQLSSEVTMTMADARHLIQTADGQIPPMATEITGTAADLRKTIANLDNRLQPLMQNLENTTIAARHAFQQAEAMLSNLTTLSEDDSAFVYQIEETLAEVKKAAGALAVLTGYLGRHPEALLRGRQSAEERK